MKIAVVIPWFGRELKGGAEQHAWQVSARLAARGHRVEVLTTCCRSHQDDWATNHLAVGESREPEGFTVRRFPVDPRNRSEFDRVCGYLLSLDPATLQPGVSPVSRADSHIFTTELIKSAGLIRFIELQKENFDRFLFLPYLYGPILEGVRIVGQAAALQPCLHDEAYAYLPEVADAFHRAGSLLFISEGEQELAFRLFGPGIWCKSTLTGAGIEPGGAELEPITRRARHPEKFLLYLGRKDAGKNVPLLLKAFARFRNVRPNSSLQLLLAGHGRVDLNGGREEIADLGLVPDQEKLELLQHCTALVQPSQNESFSRVMMEAWLHGKPVAAHSRCLATSVAVERSGGGWVGETESDWARLFTEIDRLPAEKLDEIGQNGKRYAKEIADWELVMDRHETALADHSSPPSTRVTSPNDLGTIDQFLPNLAYGDAISNTALFIRDQLRELGFRSEIYVRFVDPRVADQCKVFSPETVSASSAIIYHHSIGSEITPHIVRYLGPKCLIYHNITPAVFFEPYRPAFASILRKGREDLQQLAASFPISSGDSAFNVQELEECGFSNPGILPVCIDPRKWDAAPNEALMRKLQDGRNNLLFVGRIAPNKRHDDLLISFRHYRELDPTARLVLVGSAESEDPFQTKIHRMVNDLGLQEAVIFPGNIPDTELAAYYRTAHLFWSMSEHEGFGVPLIEAMWFDVPVFAFDSTAVKETLGEAAFMFQTKDSPADLAAAAHLIVTDSHLRHQIITAQRRARSRFLPVRVASDLLGLVAKLTSATVP